jgi:hypothetical protein
MVTLFDALQVASEDTILYTAREYTSKLNLRQPAHAQHALKVLAPLVRCPQLSRYWLSGAVHAADHGQTLLSELRPQMWQLLLLRDAQEEYAVQEEDLREGQLLAGAPPSWALGYRVFKQVQKVQLVWQVDVSELRDAARRSAAEQSECQLWPPATTPPLRGTAFSFILCCDCKEGGMGIGLFGDACNLYCGMHFWCSARLDVDDICVGGGFTPRPYKRHESFGWSNVFGLGPMAGGWDEVAWASKGLPSSGYLNIKITVV